MNKFTTLIKESIEEKYKSKISDDYKNLKISLLQSIDKSLEKDDLESVKDFIDNIIDSKEITSLIDLIEETDVINLYLKFQNDIDEISQNENWFDEVPSSNNVTGLNDFVVQGTKNAILYILKEIKKEIK